MSTPTSASGSTNDGTRASPMPLRRVGENVPEVTSPSGYVGGQADRHVRPRDAAAGGDQAAQHPRRAGLPLGGEHLAAPERVLLPADRPAEPGLVGRDVEGDVLAVQRVAHLGAQRVAGAEAAGQDAVRLAGRHQRVPQGDGDVVRGDQLVAALAGVAGAADHDVGTLEGRDRERHVVVADRQADRREHLVGLRALDGEHGVVAVLVGDGDAGGGGRGEPAHDLGGVGGVGDEQHAVVVVHVGDQVVDDAAGRVVAAQRVLRLARADPAQVVGEGAVDEVDGARAGDDGLAEVADVEDADRLADRGVLLDHAGGVLQRHRPAAEVRELRAERLVPVVERGDGAGRTWPRTYRTILRR